MMQALRGNDPVAIGAYRLEGRLGERVFYGRRGDGLPVAIHPFLVPGSHELLGRMPPFCTARVLDTGRMADPSGEWAYVVSEFVPGPSLAELVSVEGPRGGHELDQAAVRTLTALGALHNASIVHGDLHPGNVICGPEGPTVTGFGIARGSRPAYAAPEQVAADEFTPAGDMFAWASTIVHAATGRPPFGDGEPAAVFDRILRAQPDLGTMSGALRDVVAACLAKDPAARPTAHYAQQLLISGTPSASAQTAWKQPQVRPPAPKKKRDLRVPVMSGIAVVAVIGVVAGWLLLGNQEQPKTALLANNQRPAATPTPIPTPTPTPTPKPSHTKRKTGKIPIPTVTVQVPVYPQPQPTPTKRKRSPKPVPTVTKTVEPTTARPKETTERPTLPPTPSPSPAPEQATVSVRNRATGMCLAVGHGEAIPGKNLIQWPCTNGPEQQWTRKGGQLINKATGMCLGKGDGKPGRPAVQNPCNGNAVQYWAHQGGRLVNAATGLCLVISHSEARAGKYATLWKCNAGWRDQQWDLQ
ncbi:ricin-type beta-trefoil lectin domain protein [Nonomuraea jabiensis]|uniref:ricin-type beta-trefoil lectin domain protein n=1 Tax=Nonomuraea jabiensis TaxID=882448 RepID=UPI0036C1045B